MGVGERVRDEYDQLYEILKALIKLFLRDSEKEKKKIFFRGEINGHRQIVLGYFDSGVQICRCFLEDQVTYKDSGKQVWKEEEDRL